MSDSNFSDQNRGEQAAYYLALGYFMQTFAVVEATMQVILWKASGIPDMKTATALLSGVKIDSAMSLIRRVRETKKLAEHMGLEHAFQQLGVINSARNDIVHFGATFLEGIGPTISNFRAAHIQERIRGFIVSPRILVDMTADLTTITNRLLEIAQNYDDNPCCDGAVLDAWLYKHKLLTNNRQKNPDKTPKRQRPQKPSRG